MASYADISDMLLSGYTIREVAEEYGISPSTVSVTARRGGMEYNNGVWTEPATGRVERTTADKIADFFRGGIDVIKNIIMEPTPPEVPPERPQVAPREPLGFGVQNLPRMFPTITDDGREHMDIIVNTTIKNKDGTTQDIVRNFKILQRTDSRTIRRTLLAKQKYINRETIVRMQVWINDDDYQDWGPDDFIADAADYPVE